MSHSGRSKYVVSCRAFRPVAPRATPSRSRSISRTLRDVPRSGIRVIGPHPRHPGLLYNLGCNGVGFLPSIFGGHRVSQALAGEPLAPSIFDPRARKV
jgi:glycine/D-amino acid oxidase-like deaminating enzyme